MAGALRISWTVIGVGFKLEVNDVVAHELG